MGAMQRWIIVYVAGCSRTKITLAMAWDYEFCEYMRASRYDWSIEDRPKAAEYAKQLARVNSLKYTSDDPEDDFLD